MKMRKLLMIVVCTAVFNVSMASVNTTSSDALILTSLRELHVGHGDDIVNCGSKESPCRTIDYAVSLLPANSGTIKLMSRDRTYMIRSMINFTRDASFKLIGLDENINVTVQVPPRSGFYDRYLFYAFGYNLSINVHVSNVNLNCSNPLIRFLIGNSSHVKIHFDRTSLFANRFIIGRLVDVASYGKTIFKGSTLVNIKHCVFAGFETFGLIHVNSIHVTTLVNILDTNFTTMKVRGSMIRVLSRGSVTKINLNKVQVINNRVEATYLWKFNMTEKWLEVLMDYSRKSNFMHLHDGSNGVVMVNNSIFKNNTAGGALVSARSKSHTSCLKMRLANTVFSNNQINRHDGAVILISRITSHQTFASRHQWTVNLDTVKLYGNHGTGLFVNFEKRCQKSALNCTKTSKTMIDVSVVNSIFSRNTARIQGGAIHVVTTSFSPSITLLVDSSEFFHNFAESGGAIAAKSRTHIINSTFLMNRAKVGGAVLLRNNPTGNKRSGNDFRFISRIINTIFISNHSMMDIDTACDIENVTMTFRGRRLASTQIFHHGSSSNLLWIKRNFNVSCGSQQTVTEKPIREKSKDGQRYTKFLTFFSISCRSCEKGTYTTHASTGKWNSSSYKLDVDQIECRSCPRGGYCSKGRLQSRENYWGEIRENGEVRFVKCPRGQCTTSSFQSCARHRVGRLCSDCEQNYSLSLLSSACVNTRTCDPTSWIPFMFIVPVIIAMGVVGKNNIKYLIHRIVLSVKQKCGREQKEDTGNDRSVTEQIKVVVYYYQIYKLLNIPNTAVKPIWESLQEFVAVVFSVSLGEETGMSFEQCLPQSFSFVEKTIINIWLSTSPIILTVVTYILLRLIQWRSYGHNTAKVQFQVAIFQLRSILYMPLASSLFQLITCVQVTDADGQEISALFGQGSLVCYTTGQIITCVIICIWIVPYFLSLYVGTLLLHERKRKEFYFVAFLPIASIIIYCNNFVLQVCGKGNMKDEMSTKALHFDEPCVENGVTSSKEDTGLNTNRGGHKNIKDEIQLLSPSEKRQSTVRKRTQTADDACKLLLDVIQEPFLVKYWPSVIIIRGLLISAVPISFHHDHTQVLATMLIISLYFALLIRRLPYKDPVVNRLEVCLMFLLLVVGVIGIINTTYLSTADDNILELLQQLNVIKFIVLILPVPLHLIFTITRLLSGKCSRDNTESNKAQNEEESEFGIASGDYQQNEWEAMWL